MSCTKCNGVSCQNQQQPDAEMEETGADEDVDEEDDAV